MRLEDIHLSDQELLLAADGELSGRSAARVQSHLAACWACRVRKQEMEDAVGDLVRAYKGGPDGRISPADGPRALLKAQMARLAEAEPRSGWPWYRGLLAAAAALALVAYLISPSWLAREQVSAATVMVPDHNLTPGATVLISREEVCRGSNTRNKAVPANLQRKVFEEYGIRAAEPRAYEVDYLITPALGGADDIHNLWPESYAAPVWNASVKDALEDHLRTMVCQGQLDLETAQREIAGNWIEAYKKYFRTDFPLPARSRSR